LSEHTQQLLISGSLNASMLHTVTMVSLLHSIKSKEKHENRVCNHPAIMEDSHIKTSATSTPNIKGKMYAPLRSVANHSLYCQYFKHVV